MKRASLKLKTQSYLMKKLAFLLLAFITFNASAQDLVGRKIIQGNFRLFMNSTKTYDHTEYNVELRMGKIKPNNTYWAVGGTLSGTNSTSIAPVTTNQFLIGPSVEYGKFVSLVDKLYLAPAFGGSVQGIFGDFSGVRVEAYATPLRFMYHISNNFMLNASLGSASLMFNRMGEVTQLNLNGSLSNSGGFGVFYTFK